MIKIVLKQIRDITSELIALGLSVEQCFPAIKDGQVYITNNEDLSIALKNIPYSEIYSALDNGKNYNIKMIDGALIQLMYNFDSRNVLVKYRLGFFPSPTLEEFQNNQELYEDDEIYADVIDRNVVSVPIRFDYDPTNSIDLEHPKSHLTVGQYKNCRIPVSSPITPDVFMEFILRNFYNTALTKYSDRISFDKEKRFEDCISESEKKLLHIAIF